MLAVAPATAMAAGSYGPLTERLSPDVATTVFPGAADIEISDAEPAVAIAHDSDGLSGYLFSTDDMVEARGYGGEPFDIIVGLSTEGRITGTYLRAHREPIIGPHLIPEERLAGYLGRLRNLNITRPLRRSGRGVDGVSGASISAVLMHSAVVMSARRVARMNGLMTDDDGAAVRLDMDGYTPATWPDLLLSGRLARTSLVETEAGDIVARETRAADGAKPFIELFAGLATPAAIGRNLLGDKWYGHHRALLNPGEQMILVAGVGPYPWKRAARARVVQGDRVFTLGADRQLPIVAIRAEQAPRPSTHALYRLPSRPAFDPLAPWRLELAVDRGAAEPAVFTLPYRVPVDLVSGDDLALEAAGLKDPEPAFLGLTTRSRLTDWQLVWADRVTDIAILGGLLVIVTLIFIFENPLTRRRRLYRAVRLAVLGFVLVWLGWITNAQLTVINILTYFQAAFGNLDWRLFLLDPLIFIVSVYTLATLVLLGRGVFCGWLCPFGALQELLANLARVARIPAVSVPETVQARLWMVKHAVLLMLLAIAAFSMDQAARVAEIEPFKTAIVLKFERAWPFVLYALILLSAGLFIERFFCRFLCPLGGALALFGRFHMLNWLRRRPECGNPCHLCEASCPIGAIDTAGRINMNECLQCLDCQVDYHDDRRCPPLVARRARHDRLAAAS